jgi:aryl-alcohol dehydrogenase-like predicted oxidoreductase
MGLSATYEPGSIAPEDGVVVIHRALDAGVTLLDTSDAYGPYVNEELVGQAIAGRRDGVVVGTKAGCAPHSESFVPRPDGRPETLRRCCDASLRRLGLDTIDLWTLHRRDPDVPVDESVGAMGEMVAAGKVRAVGVSELTLDELEAAHAAHPLAALQSELSLWTRHTLDEIVPWCAAHGVGFVPFAPLGRGFLTGSIGADTRFVDGDVRAVNPRFTTEALRANQAIVERVRAVAARRGVTPAQVALAWVLAQGDHVVPIPGSTTVDQVDENVSAVDVELTDADLADLDALPAAVGERY